MRKIETQMNRAIRTGKNFSSSNTAVSHDSEGANVYLHGNHIATVKHLTQSSSKMEVGNLIQLSPV